MSCSSRRDDDDARRIQRDSMRILDRVCGGWKRAATSTKKESNSSWEHFLRHDFVNSINCQATKPLMDAHIISTASFRIFNQHHQQHRRGGCATGRYCIIKRKYTSWQLWRRAKRLNLHNKKHFNTLEAEARWCDLIANVPEWVRER